MKRLCFIFFVFLFSSNLNAQNQEFKLVGTNSPYFNKSKAYLYIKSNDYRKVLFVDSTILNDGEFKFSGLASQPASNASMKLVTEGKTYFADFVIDTGFNKISFKEENLISNYFRDVDMRSVSNLIKMKLDSVQRKVVSDYRSSHKIDEGAAFSLPKSDNHLIDLEYLKIIGEYPNNYYSLISLYFKSKFASMSEYTDLILKTFDTLSLELKNSEIGQQLVKSKSADAYAILASKEGKLSPIFSTKDDQNQAFTNQSLSGKPYLIVFTATWCVPCQKQLPKLKQIASTYRNQGLKVIYVSLDDDLEKWKKHIKTIPTDWLNVSDRQKGVEGHIAKSFHVTAIPTYFLINAQNMIVYNSDATDPALLRTEEYIKNELK